MGRPRTAAERYLADRLRDPDYRAEYTRARRQIDQIDAVVRALDARRQTLELTKAELARRAGMKPEAVRRLFAAESPNPTLSTISSLAAALELEIGFIESSSALSEARSAPTETHRRTA
jgi:DNA-binding phage protein